MTNAPAAKTAKHSFLWTDLETTGLDPAKGAILEFAVVLADDAPDGDLTEVNAFDAVIAFDVDAPRDFEIDPYVQSMHARNGLWDECKASACTLADAEDALVELVESLGATPRSIVLAGGSVHFDLAWYRHHMPRFAAFLSHRVFDVSTLKAAERIYGAPWMADIKRDRHRALVDIRASLAEAREIIRDRGRWAATSEAGGGA